ncbi:MAG: hypothetical protein RLZ10_607 [Bacteroidota bacterium]|jgi:uncharacterized protein (TIGR02145 family)
MLKSLVKINLMFLASSFILVSCSTETKKKENVIQKIQGKPVDRLIAKEEKKERECDKIRGILLGDQLWANQNLNVKTFANGDLILFAKDKVSWMKAGLNHTPAYYIDEISGDVYYNYYVLNDKRRLLNENWEIPDQFDWAFLAEFFGSKVYLDRDFPSMLTFEVKNNLLAKSIFAEGVFNKEFNFEVSGFNAQPARLIAEDGYMPPEETNYCYYWTDGQDKNKTDPLVFKLSKYFTYDHVIEVANMGDGYLIRPIYKGSSAEMGAWIEN